MRGILPKDVVAKLLRKKPIWFQGGPIVEIEGKEKEFGKMKFIFPDETITFNIYLYDKNEVEESAKVAIRDFKEIAQQVYRERTQ